MRTVCPCACDGELDLRFQDVPTGHTDELMGMEPMMKVLNFPPTTSAATHTHRACLVPVAKLSQYNCEGLERVAVCLQSVAVHAMGEGVFPGKAPFRCMSSCKTGTMLCRQFCSSGM